MQKSFTIFDENFEIGRVKNTTFNDYATLKNFNPGSMTRAILYVQVQLDPQNTGWGLMGKDEFEVAVWINNTSGDPAVDVWLHNKEYSKIESAPVTPIYGDNTFTLRIDKGHNEGGHTKGHVKVWLVVEYSDPNNPPGGNAPVNTVDKIVQWISDHPIETAIIGVAGLFAYDQYSGGKVRTVAKKGVQTAKQGKEVVVNIITGEEAQKALETAKTVTKKAKEVVTKKAKEKAPEVAQTVEQYTPITARSVKELLQKLKAQKEGEK